MNRILSYLFISIYSVFLGSQITEGCLLVPYWKSLSSMAFYDYYAQFGGTIGRFYTTLTIVAVLIPIGTSVYCFLRKVETLRQSLLSSFFSILVILLFYAYLKEINQQFSNADLSAVELQSELLKWEWLHWTRVFLEFLSLFFLIFTFHNLNKNKGQS